MLVSQLSQGKLEGAAIGSTAVTYAPGPVVVGGEHRCDTGTAGSIALLVQVSLPCIVFAQLPARLMLLGGTHVDHAPPIEFLSHILFPLLARMGVDAHLEVERRGYFPKGGGRVAVTCNPLSQENKKPLAPLTLVEQGTVTAVTALVVTSKLPKHVGERSVKQLRACVGADAVLGKAPLTVNTIEDNASLDTGMSVLLWAETTTGCILAGEGKGAKGVRAEDVVSGAVDGLTALLRSGSCVDEHLQDQLIVFMALAVSDELNIELK